MWFDELMGLGMCVWMSEGVYEEEWQRQVHVHGSCAHCELIYRIMSQYSFITTVLQYRGQHVDQSAWRTEERRGFRLGHVEVRRQ